MPNSDDNNPQNKSSNAPSTETPEYEYNEMTGEIEIKKAGDNTKEIKEAKEQKAMQNYVRYSSLGFQMLAAMLLGVFGGLQLDKWLHTAPWLTVLLTLFGVGMAMFIIIREVGGGGNTASKKNKN